MSLDPTMKVIGLQEVRAFLRHGGERVEDKARKVMHRAADAIVKEARINAPYDTGALQDSIHKVVGYEYRGRLAIDVVAGGFVDGVNVGDYATFVHENYDDAHPGIGTAIKRTVYPDHFIGSKYLARALETVQPKLERAMIQAVTAAFMNKDTGDGAYDLGDE